MNSEHRLFNNYDNNSRIININKFFEYITKHMQLSTTYNITNNDNVNNINNIKKIFNKKSEDVTHVIGKINFNNFNEFIYDATALHNVEFEIREYLSKNFSPDFNKDFIKTCKLMIFIYKYSDKCEFFYGTWRKLFIDFIRYIEQNVNIISMNDISINKYIINITLVLINVINISINNTLRNNFDKYDMIDDILFEYFFRQLDMEIKIKLLSLIAKIFNIVHDFFTKNKPYKSNTNIDIDIKTNTNIKNCLNMYNFDTSKYNIIFHDKHFMNKYIIYDQFYDVNNTCTMKFITKSKNEGKFKLIYGYIPNKNEDFYHVDGITTLLDQKCNNVENNEIIEFIYKIQTSSINQNNFTDDKYIKSDECDSITLLDDTRYTIFYIDYNKFVLDINRDDKFYDENGEPMEVHDFYRVNIHRSFIDIVRNESKKNALITLFPRSFIFYDPKNNGSGQYANKIFKNVEILDLLIFLHDLKKIKNLDDTHINIKLEFFLSDI